MSNKLGWYIWLDATCVSGPYDSKLEAYESLLPEKRKEWIWELGGSKGKEMFLNLPIDAFSIDYHEEP